MATAVLTRRRQGFKINRWLLIGIGAIVIGIGAAFVSSNQTRASTSTRAVTTTTVSTGTITQTVSGNGSVTANQSVDLAFQASGVVQDVAVKAGDTVTSGQTLAALDAGALQSAVASAQASLASAQATLDAKLKGSATAQEITAAQAAVDSAQKAYDAKVAGPTKQALASAQASVASAQAAYAAAQQDAAAGDSTLRSLKASLDQAQVALQKAQAAYDKIAWRSDVGASSEASDLQDATIAYQKALADYNAQLTTSAPDATSSIATAKANLQSAEETLANLTPSDADIAAAKATLESAKATLAGLTEPASDTDIAIAQASVDSAQQTFKQAQLNLAQATLTAPFDGVISEMDVVRGSTASGTALVLMNTDPMHVEMKLSENDVVKVAVGQNVALTSDALASWKASGTVSYVAPSGTTSNGVVTYLVRVDFKNTDQRIKAGMTLNVDITTAQKDNVLVVPSAAILPEGNGHIVQTVGSDGKTQNVQVQTGITDGTHTEIVSGVSAGEKIAALPSSTTTTSSSSGGRPGGFFGIP